MMMNIVDIRERLHAEIDLADLKLLRLIYALVKEYQTSDQDIVQQTPYHPEDQNTAEKKHTLIMEEHAAYLKGDRSTYSWEEVKIMAKTRNRPNEA